MRRSKNLRKLRMTFKWRLDRLEGRVATARKAATIRERDLLVAYVTIESLNAWALFSKSFYLSCALSAVTERKKRISVIPSSLPMNDALGLAIKYHRPLAKPK